VGLREGSCATYIGGNTKVVVGDRCLVLSDEGKYANVRWLTGEKIGDYELVTCADLVPDRKTKVSFFDDDGDEFGFEVEPPKAVRVATRVVHDSGGNAGLLRALEHDGVLEFPRHLAHQAVREFRQSILGDRAWREILSELGSEADGFLRSALSEIMMTALNEGGDSDASPE
jgi:hypothetical protein